MMLLNTTYKILTSIIKQRLDIYLERKIRNCLQGFRKGRSTIDAIHIILTQTIEKCHEYIKLHKLFIDFRQAFDSIIRETLIEEMKSLEIPQKLIRLTKMAMQESTARVSTAEGISGEIKIGTGVRQGDSLFTALFNIALERIIRKVDRNGRMMNKSVQILAYADDIAILARDKKSMTETFTALKNESKKEGIQ